MTLVAIGYQYKRDLQASIGKKLVYQEVSLFGPEYKSNGHINVVGPSEYVRKWFAQVTMENDIIIRVT